MQRSKRAELTKKEKYKELERKYQIKKNGDNIVIEELKQRLQVNAAKLKRDEQRIHQFRINRLFQQDQKKVCQEFNGISRSEGVAPDAEERERFWTGIWGNDVKHNGDAEWLKELKDEYGETRQDDILINLAMVTALVKKIPN